MKPLSIAEPCHERWDAMRQDRGARHCASCDKHVVDLSALTAGEIRGLVRVTGGDFCARQVIRDGALVVQPEPIKTHSRFALRVVVGGTILASAFGVAACQPAGASAPIPVELAQVDPDPTRGSEPPERPPAVFERNPDVIEMGKMVMPTPRPESYAIAFEPRGTKLPKAELEAIRELASLIKKSAWMETILVEGHLTRAESSSKNGAAIAVARANAVKNALVKQGVSALRLKVVARDFTQPLALTSDGDNLNSRVTFRVCTDPVTCK